MVLASHDSLRDDFAVSSEHFEAIVTGARGLPGCYGARLTGGGFAGCALALVNGAALDGFVAALPPTYRAATGHEATVYVCTAADGASVMPAASA